MELRRAILETWFCLGLLVVIRRGALLTALSRTVKLLITI